MYMVDDTLHAKLHNGEWGAAIMMLKHEYDERIRQLEYALTQLEIKTGFETLELAPWIIQGDKC